MNVTYVLEGLDRVRMDMSEDACSRSVTTTMYFVSGNILVHFIYTRKWRLPGAFRVYSKTTRTRDELWFENGFEKKIQSETGSSAGYRQVLNDVPQVMEESKDGFDGMAASVEK